MSSDSTADAYPPEYVNYDNGPYVIRVITVVIVLATLFVGLRIGARIQRRVGLALDDWLAIAALLVAWAEYVDGYLCIKLGGVGLHLPIALERRPNALRNVFIYMFGGELLFFTCLALIKLSVLAMYYRIFPTRFMKWGCVALGSMTGAWWLAVMFATIFQCTPVRDYWETFDSIGSCVNADVFYLSTNGIPNIVMDAMILCLPFYEVYKLHMSRKLKVAVAANFLIGSFVMIASIIKLVVMVHLYYLGPAADVTYYLADLVIWVEVEPCMGIISACLPTLRPLFTFFMRRVGLTRDASARASTPGKPSLVTFGQGNARSNKRPREYTTVLDLEHGAAQGSLERLGGWPEEQQGPTTSVMGVEAREADVELHHFQAYQPHSIAVRTELAWNESYTR